METSKVRGKVNFGKKRDTVRATSKVIKGKDQEIMMWKEEYGYPSV